MKLSLLKTLLKTHPDKQFRLLLPGETPVPISFHITEVGHVTKKFMDCGGQVHSTQTCQLQAWIGDDTDHRIAAGKMAEVLDRSACVLPSDQDLDVEIEYEDTAISQYPVDSCTITGEAVVLNLSTRHTDCLAKDICLPQTLPLSLAPQPGCGCGPGCC